MNTEALAIRERSSQTKFGPYEVQCREDGSIYRMGQGATSSSYKAVDTDLRTPVVLKVMRPELFEDETARKRFLREARAAALLRHPNVAQIYRLGEQDGTCFYAREFIEGETLESRVDREGPLEVTAALKVALRVAEALIAVKEARLVHRDIKPSNLMMTPRGEVKIIDFGLAKSNASGEIDGVGQITMRGFMGSFDYASPEQLSEEPLDVSSDIYSLGVTLWFLLTGRRPFRGPQVKVMSAHLDTPPPFEELSGFSTPVVSLLAHMLEKDPARRPTTPAELVAEINGCLNPLTRPPETASAVGPALAAAPVPVARKVSAAREPARERSPRQFVLVELMIGTVIAVIVYLILSRPADLPAPATAALDQTSDTTRIAPPPAGNYEVAKTPATAADPASSKVDGAMDPSSPSANAPSETAPTPQPVNSVRRTVKGPHTPRNQQVN